MQPVIGNFYLALDNESPFMYVVTGKLDKPDDYIINCTSISLMGGDHFSLDNEDDYVSAFITDRQNITNYLVKYRGQPIPIPDSERRIFDKMNTFGSNPVKRRHIHIQSTDQLQNTLHEHFHDYTSQQSKRLNQLFLALNAFKKLSSPKLSL